jgi:hypothetical protein
MLIKVNSKKLLCMLLVCPIWLPTFLYQLNEPGLGTGIESGMALTPFPSSIGLDSNPRPFVSQVCYPLDQTFATISLFRRLFWPIEIDG